MSEDSAEHTVTTKSGHRVCCTASRGMRDIVVLYVSIDDTLYTYGDSDSEGALYWHARNEAETVARMLEQGMIRLEGDEWVAVRPG